MLRFNDSTDKILLIWFDSLRSASKNLDSHISSLKKSILNNKVLMYPRTIVQRSILIVTNMKMNIKVRTGECHSTNASRITRNTLTRTSRETAIRLTVSGVFGQFDASLIQNLVERRPAASAVVLGVRGEQFLLAHDAGVRPLLVELVVATGKRPAPK